MSGRALDGTWPDWLKENLERKCDPEQLLETLLKNDFSVESIREHMGTMFPQNSALLEGIKPSKKKGFDQPADFSGPRLTRVDSGLNVMQMLTSKLQLYVLEDFMSTEDCDLLVDISSSQLRPSTVTTGDRDKGYRTSSTSDLGLLKHPFVAQVDEKIAMTLGIRLPYSESIQAQRYDVGQEFKAHTDAFDPGTGEYAQFAGNLGQRTWTFMVYLSNVAKGGGTRFFSIGKTFTPKKGMAVIWNNLHPDGSTNRDTMHSGLPVLEGTKIIITKWFRDKGTGPMFY